jgi:hypothetical protein
MLKVNLIEMNLITNMINQGWFGPIHVIRKVMKVMYSMQEMTSRRFQSHPEPSIGRRVGWNQQQLK